MCKIFIHLLANTMSHFILFGRNVKMSGPFKNLIMTLKQVFPRPNDQYKIWNSVQKV